MEQSQIMTTRSEPPSERKLLVPIIKTQPSTWETPATRQWIAPVVRLEHVRQDAFFREYGPLLAPLAFAFVLIVAALIGLR